MQKSSPMPELRLVVLALALNVLDDACRDVDVAYYLVHALGSGASFEETDRATAGVMATAVRPAMAGIPVPVGVGGVVSDEQPATIKNPAMIPRMLPPDGFRMEGRFRFRPSLAAQDELPLRG